MPATGPLTKARQVIERRPLATTLVILGTAAGLAPGDLVLGPPVALATLVAAILLYRGATSGWADEDHATTAVAALGSAAVATFGINRLEGAPQAGARLWAVCSLALLYLVYRRPSFRRSWVLGILAMGTIAIWLSLSSLVNDVFLLHEGATQRIVAGQSPYSGLTVPDGSPLAGEPEIITGYPYPLHTLAPFALAEVAGLDLRWASTAIWLTVAAIVLFRVARRRAVGMLEVALIATPAWVAEFWTAWTEPLTLAYLAAAAGWWQSPWIAGVLTGLGVTSKQYLIVLGPLLLGPAFLANRRRMWGMLGAAATGLGAAVALDPRGFWNSAVLFHLSQPPRHDSVNLIGILTSLKLPVPGVGILATALGLTVAILLRKGVKDAPSFLEASATTLAATFAFTPQAFPNYWFLVLSLLLLALILRSSATQRVAADSTGGLPRWSPQPGSSSPKP